MDKLKRAKTVREVDNDKDVLRSCKNICLIIDGKTLSYAMEEIALGNKFFRFGLIANSVICCRVSAN